MGTEAELDREVEALVARVNSGGLGGWRRLRAVRRLADMRSPAAVRGLARAYASSADREVAGIAEQALGNLADQAATDALCEVLIDTGDERLAGLVARAGYQHSDPGRRAVMLLLAGEFERYAELDFDGDLLAGAYASADESLRARLAERAGVSGRVDWLRVIGANRGADRLRGLSDREWEATVGVLAAGGRWEQLWQLATEAPPVWGVRMLRELAGQSWRPDSEAERGRFDRLADLARKCENLVTAELTVLTGHQRGVSCLAVTPDSSLLASGGLNDGTLRLWRLPSGEPAGVQSADTGGERPLLAAGGYTGGVECLVVSPDGQLLASGGHDGMVRLWHLPSGELAGVLTGHERGVLCLVVSPDGQLLASGGHDGMVRLWHLPSGEPAGVLSGHKGSVARLALIPDGSLLASSSYLDRTVRLWHLPSGEPAGVLSGHKGSVLCLAVSPDGSLLASGGFRDGMVRLWRLPSGEPVGVLTGHKHKVSVPRLAVSPDGQMLASGSDDGEVRLWRLPSGEPVGVLTGHEGGVSCLAVSPDGSLLASGSGDRMVRLWNLPSGEPTDVLTGHEDVVLCLAVTPDGQMLASAGYDGEVRLWHLTLRAASRTPAAEVDLAAVERLRDSGPGGQVRVWATLISELAWRRAV